MANSILEIDLAALSENVRQITAYLSPGAKLCAVVKANAYGLGAARIAPELERLGVEWMAVYDLPQAEEILEAGVGAQVLILMPVTEIEAGTKLESAARKKQIHFALHSVDQMKSLASVAGWLGTDLAVHVEIDTGMSRGGELPEPFDELVNQTLNTPGLSVVGAFTHPSSADWDVECTARQAAMFDQALAKLPGAMMHHIANTWAALGDKRNHRSLVRVGLGLWGYPSSGESELADRSGVRLRPIARWVSEIVHVKTVPAGSDVGYNRTFRTARATRIGIVPVGYADGYPLLLSNAGVVRVGPDLRAAPVLGRVNMDQLIIDLTDTAGAGVGSIAELISNDPTAPNAMHNLAKMAQSHAYEMLCRISNRVPRKYV